MGLCRWVMHRGVKQPGPARVCVWQPGGTLQAGLVEVSWVTLRCPNPMHLVHAPEACALPLCGVCVVQDEGGSLVLARDKVNMEVLNAAGGEINNALTNPFFGVL